MGIYRKYDLTAYLDDTEEPSTYYTCDRFVVECYDAYDSWERRYETWEEARSYALRLMSDEQFEDTNVSVQGLVYD